MEHRGFPSPSASGRNPRRRARLRRVASLVTAVALTVTGLAVVTVTAPVAAADPGPVQTTADDVVTAEALPTVQINGVVWQQAVVGNYVYAGGNFTKARPAGAAAGTNESSRTYLLAYDITTGVMTSWAPTLNGEVKSIAASPDGTRLYVGGTFTSINGTARSRIAVFDLRTTPATPTLITSFLGSAGSSVNAIAATNETVYIGGDFTSARGNPRNRLAALNNNGDLLGWNPGADNTVYALVMSPDQTRVIVGGRFLYMANWLTWGNGAIDAKTGGPVTWNANIVIKNYGQNAAILGLSADSSTVYLNGYVYEGTGNLEGAVAVDPSNGNIKWIEDCHGDSYATYAPKKSATNVMYVVNHAHYCGNVGGQPQTVPWTYQRAMAFTKSVTGTLTNNGDANYYNYAGRPSPSVINWFPQIAQGSFTGQNQGAWAVTGNDKYVVLGGEFPRVNGVNQQGLVRFAVRSVSNGLAPVYSGANMVPTLSQMGGGAIKATVTTNWDRDDSTLTYQLLRNGQVVNSASASSTYWNRPKVTVSDSGLTAGTTYKYQIRTVDAAGNTATGNQVSFTATATTPPVSSYAQLVAQQGSSAFWRMGDTGTVYDWSGTNDASFGSGVTRGVPGAINGDANKAASFNGTENGRMSTKNAVAGPQIYSAEAWFKTTTTSGGKILGFGASPTGINATYDRHIYMDNAGKLYFGNYQGGIKTVSSPKSYNDGSWHQVVATLSRSGAVLYVDGVQVAKDTSTTGAAAYNGYWRVGGDNLDSWTGQPSSRYFNGSIDEVSIYPTALTADQVQAQYQASNPGPNTNPTAAFTSTTQDLTANFDGSSSNDPDGSIVSYSWDFGDGTTGTGAKPSHAYASGGTYTVTLTVKDNRDGTASVSNPVTVKPPPQPPVAAFTATASNLNVAFDASGSTDPDNDITSYAWDFGDGQTGTGATTNHAYGTAGPYQVRLTVTDSTAKSSSITKAVAAGAGQGAIVAADAFERAVAGGFGTADQGGDWTLVGTATSFGVSNGVGTMTMGARGATPAAYLTSLSQSNVDATTTFSLDKLGNGNGINISLAARRTGTSDYRLITNIKPDGTVGIQPTRVVNGVATNLISLKTVPGLTYNVGDSLRMRFQVTGATPSTLRGKVWKVGTAEPADWQVTATNSQAELQGSGGAGLITYLSTSATNAPVVTSFDNFVVQVAQ